MKAEYSLTFNSNGELLRLLEAFPSHELEENSIEISKEDFYLLGKLPDYISLDEVINRLQEIKHRIDEKLK